MHKNIMIVGTTTVSREDRTGQSRPIFSLFSPPFVLSQHIELVTSTHFVFNSLMDVFSVVFCYFIFCSKSSEVYKFLLPPTIPPSRSSLVWRLVLRRVWCTCGYSSVSIIVFVVSVLVINSLFIHFLCLVYILLAFPSSTCKGCNRENDRWNNDGFSRRPNETEPSYFQFIFTSIHFISTYWACHIHSFRFQFADGRV